jgi:hypothetical protein
MKARLLLSFALLARYGQEKATEVSIVMREVHVFRKG